MYTHISALSSRSKFGLDNRNESASSEDHDSLPVFLFSAFAFAAAASALFLPEVHGEALPDTLEDLERLVDGTRMWSMTGKKNESRRRRRTSTMRKSEGE